MIDELGGPEGAKEETRVKSKGERGRYSTSGVLTGEGTEFGE